MLGEYLNLLICRRSTMKSYSYADDTYLLKDDCEYEPYGVADCTLATSSHDHSTAGRPAADHVIEALVLSRLGSSDAY
jgi:hypothetical protein